MINENGMRSIAAICYLEQDRDYALKMQKFLSSYKLPSAIDKDYAKARASISVICSEIRLSGDILAEKPEFIQADYLLLLCSKEIVKQNLMYLDYDLRTFMEEKRGKGVDPATRIIPILISGELDEQAQDCFPLPIKAMGADGPKPILRNKLKNDREVYLHALSRLLGLESSALSKQEQKKRNYLYIATVSLLVLVIGLGLFYAMTVMEFKYHYLDFTMQYGIPQGIHPLSDKEQQRVAGHYIITKKNGRVISLEYVDSYGRRIDHDATCWRSGNRPSAYLFEYDSSGLSAVTYEDRFGRPYFVMEYTGVDQVQLKDPYNRSIPHYIAQHFSYSPGVLLEDPIFGFQPLIGAFSLKYSNDGYLVQAQFHCDRADTLAHDQNVYGIAFARDSAGRVIEQHYLNAEGKVCENHVSVATVCFAFDDKDNCTELKFLNIEGELTGHSWTVMEYDADHNLISRTNLNNKGVEISRSKYIVDDRGNPLWVNTKQYTYDDRGYLVEMVFTDPYYLLSNPYASVKYVRDEMGNVLEESYFDADGNPQYISDNYARIVYTYNNFGQETCRSYWNAEGTEQVNISEGFSTCVKTYDERGRITSVAYFDADGRPTEIKHTDLESQYHKRTVVYEDGRFQKTTTCFYGADGQPVDLSNNYTSIVNIVNNGRIHLLQYTRSDGSIYSIAKQEAFINDSGEHEVVLHQSSNDGETIQRTVYRVNGIPLSMTSKTYNAEGMIDFEVVITYYENGTISSECYLDYDEQGKASMSVQKYFDENGEITELLMEDIE